MPMVWAAARHQWGVLKLMKVAGVRSGGLFLFQLLRLAYPDVLNTSRAHRGQLGAQKRDCTCLEHSVWPATGPAPSDCGDLHPCVRQPVFGQSQGTSTHISLSKNAIQARNSRPRW